jgi:hypothetical protein
MMADEEARVVGLVWEQDTLPKTRVQRAETIRDNRGVMVCSFTHFEAASNERKNRPSRSDGSAGVEAYQSTELVATYRYGRLTSSHQVNTCLRSTEMSQQRIAKSTDSREKKVLSRSKNLFGRKGAP